MEGNNVCRFCLKILVDQNFDIGDTTLEILNILSTEIDLGIDEKSPMCRNCRDTIDRCFTFKSACISSEDSIAEYITEDSKVDLEEVYLKAELKRIPKGHKICRLCMKVTIIAKCLNTTDTLFALASDKLRKCIPEFNLYIVKQPVICEACLVGLQRYYEFVTCCLDVEKKINRYCEARGVDKKQVRLYNVLQFILNESLASDISKRVVSNRAGTLDEIQLNIEVNCTELGSAQFDDRMGKIEVKSEDEKKSCSNKINESCETGIINKVQCPVADHFTQNDDINCDKEIYDLDAEGNRCSLLSKTSLPRKIKGENGDENQLRLSTEHSFNENSVAEICIKSEEIEIKSEDAEMSANKDCDSQDNTLLQMKSGKKKHNEARRIKNKVFFCEICSTSYHSKYLLERHNLLVHVEDPLVKLFRCKQCSFISEYKESLNNHKKVHKGNSELNMHKCKECEFMTKYKGNLKAHSLARHQDSEVQVSDKHVLAHSKMKIYPCNLCNYNTKFKRHLVYHAMTHKDKSELPTYDCFHCSYKAKRKSHLRNHMKTHKTMREFVMLKSETCDFISEDKFSMTNHKDQSDTRVYSCDKGTITTNHKSSLKNDMLIQTDSSQLKMFKCEICPYQATSSTELNQHSLIHPEVKQAHSTTYNCTHCSYKTRNIKYLKMHLFIHNDKSLGELPGFKCFLCSYQTVRKKHLERHLQNHKKGSVIELWKCKICGGEYSKFHVKTHQRTCVGQEDDVPDS